MAIISEFYGRIVNLLPTKTKKQKGVGLYIGVESFSLCVIDDLNDMENSTRFYCTKFPATVKDYALDFFTNDKSRAYIFDYIKEFVPKDATDINLILPDSVASIAVTPVQFATEEQAQGYARFQSQEIFGKNYSEPIFSACKIENSVSKSNKQDKSRYIVSCAAMCDMQMLKESAVEKYIDLTTTEPIALCALRSFSDISQGNVLFLFINLSHLFLVSLINGRPEKFYNLHLDTEEDGFLEKFSKEIMLILENLNFERNTLKIKIAGNEMKYKICETLDRLNIAKEVSLAKCKINLASCEDELAFGAALRNL